MSLEAKTRKRIHVVLLAFFAVQIPIALWLQNSQPVLFEKWWKQYLIFLSLYAIVSTHWAGASAETPDD